MWKNLDRTTVMANHISSVVAVALLMASGSMAQTFPQAYPGLCGTWGAMDQCIPYGEAGDNVMMQQSITLDGVSAGVAIVSRKLYINQDSCADGQESITAMGLGQWKDFGPSNSQDIDDNTRKIMLNLPDWKVTTNTADGAASMQSNCGCGQQWKAGTTADLSYCRDDTCPSTAMVFGGIKTSIQYAYQVGTPGFTLAVVNNTAPSVTIGRLSSDLQYGFSRANLSDAQMNQDGTACAAPKEQADMCATYYMDCVPEFDAVNGELLRYTNGYFHYNGPAGAGSFDLSTGLYNFSRTYFHDAACSVSFVTVEETGTLGLGAYQTVPAENTMLYKKFAASVDVTVTDKDYLKNININCQCGDGTAFQLNQMRRLTQCDPNKCNAPSFYDGVNIGKPSYGTIRHVVSGNFDQLQLSQPVLDQNEAQNQKLSHNNSGFYLDVLDPFCPVTDALEDNYCGTYKLYCSNYDGTMRDMTATMSITGQPTQYNDADGKIDFIREYYSPDTGCMSDSRIMKVEADGYYADAFEQQTRGIEVTFPRMSVTPFTDDMTSALNNDQMVGCPCGGTWVTGQTRVLTSCPNGTCPGSQYLGGAGTLGTPGFGQALRVKSNEYNYLQLSDLSSSEKGGIIGSTFSYNNFPLQSRIGCLEPKYSSQVCGNYFMPCHFDSKVADFVSHFQHNSGTGEYLLNRSDYNPGFGCTFGSILKIEQKGTLEVKPDLTPNVVKGTAVVLKVATTTITPLSQEVVGLLSQKCPCGGMWALGSSRTFTAACPANTCNDHSWLRQPLGEPVVYGVMQKTGGIVRMTEFSANKDEGFDSLLGTEDYGYVMNDDSPCVKKPAGVIGGMSGSDVFILLVFLGAFMYLAIGMTMNYLGTGGRPGGTPTIPHIEFWRSLPGLVADGVNFSICQMCGMRPGGGSAKYSSFGGNPDAGYGSL